MNMQCKNTNIQVGVSKNFLSGADLGDGHSCQSIFFVFVLPHSFLLFRRKFSGNIHR